MKKLFFGGLVGLMVMTAVIMNSQTGGGSYGGGGGGVTLTQVTNVVNALAITTTSATNIVYTNASIVIASPAGGNNAFADMQAYTPQYVGQGVETFYGNKAPFIWFANGVGQGNYSNSINFAGGIGQIGDVSAQGVMDPTLFSTTIGLAGNPASWSYTNRTHDTVLFVASGQTYGSGEAVSFPTIITNAVTGAPITIFTVDNEIIYSQTNSLIGSGTALLPGYMGFQQNFRPTSLGSYAGRVGGVGADTGNHAGWMFDMSQKRVWFPVWTASVYVPTDVGWVGSHIDNDTGAANFIGVTTLSNLQVTAGETITGGVLSGNGAGLTNSAHAVLSAGSMTSMAQAATASSEYAPWFWAATAATTINVNKFRIPYGGFLTNFWVEDDTGLGVGTNVVYTIFTNGVACNLNATATGGGTAVAFSTSNLTTSVFIPAGTYLHFNMSNACPSAPANQLMNWSVELYR